jgi:outer membrane lipoprotein-sorting protein
LSLATRLRSSFGIFTLAFCLALSGCAAKRLALPTDAGTPLPDFAQIHSQVAAACTGARTLTAELALSGRAGRQRLRGRVVSGFQRPASMRLEGVAPFGPPAFILVAGGGEATLLLPRDDRVVRGTKAEEILGALTGVGLAPADLQAALTGCVGDGAARDRRSAAQRRGGPRSSWRVVRRSTCVRKPACGGFVPRVAVIGRSSTRRGRATFRRLSGCDRRRRRSAIDLTAQVSQLEVNVDVDASAFTVNVPASARPLSLQELRENGPLGAQ